MNTTDNQSVALTINTIAAELPVVAIDRANGAHGFTVMRQKDYCVQNGVKGAEGKRAYRRYLAENGVKANGMVSNLFTSGQWVTVKAVQSKNCKRMTVNLLAASETVVKEPRRASGASSAKVAVAVESAVESAKASFLAKLIATGMSADEAALIVG
jgi:hypothetical protein